MNHVDGGLARSVPGALPALNPLEGVVVDPILEMRGVGLQIPVFTTEMRSLGSSLLRSVTGGKLRRERSGAVIEAL